MTETERARLTDELRAELERSVAEQLEHPFVRGLAEGTLPADPFRHFVRQDYVFLLRYVQALALAAARAPTAAVAGRLAGVARETAEGELALHRAYAAEWDISEEELEHEPPARTTLAYTDFLLRTAALGDFGEAAAALLPCMWGYSELGRRLAAQPRSPEERYARWIDTYAAEGFAELAAWCRDVVDGAAAEASEATRERMREAFRVSSRYELAFWDAAWRLEGPL